MPNITERDCRAEVKARRKIYDAACAGLYVSLSPSALPTFFLKYTNPISKKRGTHRLGVYQQGEHDVAFWRKEAWKLRVRIANGEDIAQTARQVRRLQAKQAGITVGEIIDQRIAWFREEVVTRRHTEHGVMIKKAPRNKSWEEQSRHLNRLVRPRLGRMIAGEVTKHDIAQLQADILEGKLIVHGKPLKASVSSARHMRKAVSGLFNWAAEAGRDFVSTSPCVNLPLLPTEEPRKRKLSREEIPILWHGLDRPDITVDRRICLALKFALTTALRSMEFLHIQRDELDGHDLNSRYPQVDIPEERVKAGRVIHQPLSDLAVEIAKEAMGNYTWMFTGRFGNAPLARSAMAGALRGNRASNGRVRSLGLCEQLGLKPFTPHDLRRTAASLMGSIGISRATISLCLDHTIKSDDHGTVAAVTGKHYDQDPRIEEKRAALQRLADEIRRIISEPVEAAEDEMPLAA
ncbi:MULTISPECIES: tyrosine-type recombinase/integrase [unclassified Bradyrhizobium]|uniref:tyrosine-type recombinase/integrase n=1 Tax=unclassified Bradyrhizobium TaxID=2631580 RepID=UPI001FFA2EDE|nr:MULTISPECIES: tyrosine-type recombinase/integrase [unclassified Bradyrhizobium]MCK1303903.1 tyrosine-type recombinase/integrase [Bradyrhizobium sp. 37]MCK1770421.1 tyrosine-type recombinase/integrase [Bradyrhizobium sp. 134]